MEADKPIGHLPAAFFATKMYFTFWLILWFMLQVFTLEAFPYAHSDEAWLAGLSSAYWQEKSLLVTEPFFDMFPRQSHALKWSFHLMQIPFLIGMGHRLFAVRLLSLLTGTLSLILLFRHFMNRLHPPLFSFLIVLGTSLHIQFLYATRMARQEIALFLILILASTLYEDILFPITPTSLAHPNPSTRLTFRYLAVPLLLGWSASIHPNAFLITAMVGAVLVKDLILRRLTRRHLFCFLSVLAGSATLLLVLSLIANPRFVQDYFQFGATLGVSTSPQERAQHFIAYFHKLYQQISGTYFLPDLRGSIMLCLILIPVGTGLLFQRLLPLPVADRRGLENGLTALIGYLIAMLFLGRFNPTAILFALYPLLLLLVHVLHVLMTRHIIRWKMPEFHKKEATAVSLPPQKFPRFKWILFSGSLIPALLIGCLLVGTTLNTIRTFIPFLAQEQPIESGSLYGDYLKRIGTSLPADAVILGNLSAGFAFHGKPFHDIRNLAPVMSASTQSPAVYLSERGITHVFWYEEYEYILRNPQWRILYEADGDTPGRDRLPPQSFLSGLEALLTHHGTLLDTFEAPVYGTRIIRYMGDYPWRVSLYAIDPAAIAETAHSQPTDPSQ